MWHPAIRVGDAAPKACPGSWLAVSLWPAVRRSAALALALPVLAGASGCGQAHAPCPTPTSTLDAHRSQSEALQEDLGRVSDEAVALEERREEASRRIQEAKAVEDSLAQRSKRPAGGSRKGRR